MNWGGKNRDKKFHEAANEGRMAYKKCKFGSIKGYIDQLDKNRQEIADACNIFDSIETEITTERDNFKRDIYSSLDKKVRDTIHKSKAENLSDRRTPVVQSNPNADNKSKEFFLVKTVDPNETDEEINSLVEEHNEYVEKVFRSLGGLDQALDDVFSANSESQVYINRIREAAVAPLVRAAGCAAGSVVCCAATFGACCGCVGGAVGKTVGGAIGSIALAGGVLASPVNACCAVCKGAKDAVGRLGALDKHLTTLDGLLKKYEHAVLDMTKKQKDLKHTADFLIKDQQGLRNLGTQLVQCQGKMETALNDERSAGYDSDIIDCGRNVARLIGKLGTKLELAGQPS